MLCKLQQQSLTNPRDASIHVYIFWSAVWWRFFRQHQ